MDRRVVHDGQCVPYQFTEGTVAELRVVHDHAEGLAEVFSWYRACWYCGSRHGVFAFIKKGSQESAPDDLVLLRCLRHFSSGLAGNQQYEDQDLQNPHCRGRRRCFLQGTPDGFCSFLAKATPCADAVLHKSFWVPSGFTVPGFFGEAGFAGRPIL